MVLASLKLLRDVGHYDAYEAALPQEHREPILQAMAASWVPMRHMVAHFATIDGLGQSDAQLSRMGDVHGAESMDTLFGTLIRTARGAGAEAGIWIALKQVDRIWGRIFQGGGCSIIQSGPKDAIFEIHGLSVAGSRYFRLSHIAFVRVAVMMVARTCIVKAVPARKPDPESFAISISWV